MSISIKVSELTVLDTITSDDYIIINDSGSVTTKRVAFTTLADWLADRDNNILVTSSSYALSASYALTSSFADSASYSLSSSYALSASYALPNADSGPGSGTENYLPKWTGTNTLTATSNVFDDGTNVGVNNATPLTTLDVGGLVQSTDMGRFKGWLGTGATGVAAEIGVVNNEARFNGYSRPAGTHINVMLKTDDKELRITTDNIQLTGSIFGNRIIDVTNYGRFKGWAPTSQYGVGLATEIGIVSNEGFIASVDRVNDTNGTYRNININANPNSIKVTPDNGIQFTGSLIAPDELIGTSSWAHNAITAAYATTAAYAAASATPPTTVALVGTIIDFAGTLTLLETAYPAEAGKWKECNGDELLKASYNTLWNILGTTYGTSIDINKFVLPDFRGRTTISVGTGPGLTARSIGEQTIGAETHALTSDEGPEHSHSLSSYPNKNFLMWPYDASLSNKVIDIVEQQQQDAPPDDWSFLVSPKTQAAGNGDAHNNMQPSAVVTKLIRVLD
jgi:microcystin-dependent protein